MPESLIMQQAVYYKQIKTDPELFNLVKMFVGQADELVRQS